MERRKIPGSRVIYLSIFQEHLGRHLPTSAGDAPASSWDAAAKHLRR
jgi:hypothetical protein